MALMAMATLFSAVMQASVRHLSSGLHSFEIAFFRNLLVLVILMPWFVRYGLTPLRSKKLHLHGLRGLLTTVTMLSMFTGLALTPLAQVTALFFTAPLFATVLAVFFLRETVRLRRWMAVLFGFAGTFVVLRPGLVVIDMGSLLVILASLTWGAALIVTKVLSRTDSAVSITVYMAIIMTPLSFVPALFVWEWPTWTQLGWLTVAAVAGTGNQMSVSQALREADTSVVMPMDFFRLIWAALLGYAFFAEVPDAFTWIGGTMIFASATYIAVRESKLRRNRPKDIS
jgi:drug/metabolite transporter (DMT)-like permease